MESAWLDNFNYTEGYSAKWMRGGQEFFEHLNLRIRNASHSVHLQVYLIDPDETGRMLLDELIAAAARGVEVYLVVDGFGAGQLKETHEQELLNAGIIYKRFEPYLSAGEYYVGRRMHHKVIVIDESIAIVGGMNVANRYRGNATVKPWIDYAVEVEGPVCRELVEVCRKIITRQFSAAAPKWPRIFTPVASLDASKLWIRVRKNDWLRNRREITLSYNRAARLARKSITIVGGYFIPGRRYRRILAAASRRGVEIKIIMAQKSDVPIVKYASDYLYGWMLKNNFRIFEAKDAMVHGKAAIVDEVWSTIGSYNQNQLSAYFSIELNLDIVNREFSTGFNKHLMGVIDNECVEITEETFFRKSTILARLRRWISYQIVRLSLRIMFVVNRVFGVND